MNDADYPEKNSSNFIYVIRLLDFVMKKGFEWAVETTTKKKNIDRSATEVIIIDEGIRT